MLQWHLGEYIAALPVVTQAGLQAGQHQDRICALEGPGLSALPTLARSRDPARGGLPMSITVQPSTES